LVLFYKALQSLSLAFQRIVISILDHRIERLHPFYLEHRCSISIHLRVVTPKLKVKKVRSMVLSLLGYFEEKQGCVASQCYSTHQTHARQWMSGVCAPRWGVGSYHSL